MRCSGAVQMWKPGINRALSSLLRGFKDRFELRSVWRGSSTGQLPLCPVTTFLLWMPAAFPSHHSASLPSPGKASPAQPSWCSLSFAGSSWVDYSSRTVKSNGTAAISAGSIARIAPPASCGPHHSLDLLVLPSTGQGGFIPKLCQAGLVGGHKFFL